MEALLTCQNCSLIYNSTDREPRILPCSDLLCMQCLANLSHRELTTFITNCPLCNKSHRLSKLDDVPKSNTTLYLLNQRQNESSTQMETISQGTDNQTFVNMMQQLNKDLKLARFNIQIHYDDAINDIDIRTETLINSINTARAQMQDKLNELRNKSIDDFNAELQRLNAIDLQAPPIKIMKQLNKSEQILSAINDNLSYFSDNTLQPFDKSLIGHIVNKNMDTNFVKIKTLKSIFSGESTNSSLQISLRVNDQSGDNVIRQNVIPLSLDRVLKVYFTTRRSVKLELFDETGRMIDKLNAFDNLSSFPISAGYGNYFLLSFTSKSNSSSFFETNSSYILLYDINLKLVKMLKKFSSVESVYMNDNYICLFYAHRSNACCTLFDYELNELETFGQQIDAKMPFFMEKSTLTYKDQMNSSLKNNPKIFGITSDSIYFFSMTKMSIMRRLTGEVKTEVPISGDTPYFLLDAQSNIIQVNTVSKRIAVTNYEFDYSILNYFSDNLEDVYLTADNNLAFVDKNKEKVLFI
jgi:hypothetical protein